MIDDARLREIKSNLYLRSMSIGEQNDIADLFNHITSLAAKVETLETNNTRLQRACDEGLPREVILCPACGKPHVEGPRHDDPSISGRTRPHHTHRCYECGHVWDSGRWSFGIDPTTLRREAGDRT